MSLQSTYPMKTLLVVDDAPENIDILKQVLGAHYRIKVATNGRLALKIAAMPPRPDLILLDVMMPEMNGHEVCQQLKDNPETRDIPLIFLTSRNEPSDELRGFALGAVDYIAKPFSPQIVQARVETHLALREARQALEGYNRNLLAERKLVEGIILKMRNADDFDDRYLRYLIAPVEQTNGDLLLATFTPDQRQLLLVGDFTGHGVAAAIGGPLVAYLFHHLAQQGGSGREILSEINIQLQRRLPMSMFFAACLVEVTSRREAMRLWNAGMPNPMLVRQGQVAREFPSAAVPLGILPTLDAGDIEAVFSLEREDRLFVYSDGITECKSPAGELFGKARLADLLCRMVAREEPLDNLLEALDEHSTTHLHDDDITVLDLQAGG
ncbi:two-component system, HptB-dependent secretion and biofilm response regulator [Gammaproteobacteria bacterium]